MFWVLMQILGLYVLGGATLAVCLLLAFCLKESLDSYLDKCEAVRTDREVEMLEDWLER